tara:strand:+ start:216 stop:731 length:516 start_codon:yes stop_codon:yes gene_type:complete
MESLKSLIRNVPDFPKPGILFYDITTLLADGDGLRQSIDALANPYQGQSIDLVVGIESRGFIFGTAVADRLGVGFVPVRKPGKLPAKTVSVEYELEYGTDVLEMHEDAVREGQRVLVVDDLLATGGTAKAVVDLLVGRGAEIQALAFLIELEFLPGRQKLAGQTIHSVLRY